MKTSKFYLAYLLSSHWPMAGSKNHPGSSAESAAYRQKPPHHKRAVNRLTVQLQLEVSSTSAASLYAGSYRAFSLGCFVLVLRDTWLTYFCLLAIFACWSLFSPTDCKCQVKCAVCIMTCLLAVMQTSVKSTHSKDRPVLATIDAPAVPTAVPTKVRSTPYILSDSDSPAVCIF